MRKKSKLFVLDTNIILHDSSCLYNFQDNDIVIPIAVLEELDKFKKGKESLSFHSRKFIRSLDSITDEGLFSKGVSLGEDRGNVIVMLDENFHPDLSFNFAEDKADHHILNTAYHLSKKNRRREVILVTKDANLRMKAKAVGLKSQDYTSDHVKDISTLYKGYRIEENVSSRIIERMINEPHEISHRLVKPKKQFMPNEYIVLRNKKKSVLGYVDPEDFKIKLIKKDTAYGIDPRNAEQAFALNALLNPNIQLVTISGKAGTGKTLLALAAGLECRAVYSKVFLARPVVPLGNQDLGYLPGKVEQKLTPYIQPLYDNLGVVKKRTIGQDQKNASIKKLLEEENLVISPLAYIRGRSLVDIFFIVDEAQNLTPHEVKTIITRAGENTKMVFTGDIFQIDHPYLDKYSNGLSYLLQKMQGQKLYTHINLKKGERSELAELGSNLL
jgi:PhoH-like ATPase